MKGSSILLWWFRRDRSSHAFFSPGRRPCTPSRVHPKAPRQACKSALRLVISAAFSRPGAPGPAPNPVQSQANPNTMKTFSAKPETVRRDWYVVDATDKVLGRLATEVARRLRGKHKPEFTPHVDTGDYIVVVNAEKVRVTGNKAKDKVYYRHTGFPGGLKSMSFEKMIDHAPERVIELAVTGMMPKNPLGRAMLSKLKIYAGSSHPHAAQQPIQLDI